MCGEERQQTRSEGAGFDIEKEGRSKDEVLLLFQCMNNVKCAHANKGLLDFPFSISSTLP